MSATDPHAARQDVTEAMVDAGWRMRPRVCAADIHAIIRAALSACPAYRAGMEYAAEMCEVVAELWGAAVGSSAREAADAIRAEAASPEPTRQDERWRRCPSTHCERSQECRSPRECCVKTPEPTDARADGWRDIATAPKDGSAIDVWVTQSDKAWRQTDVRFLTEKDAPKGGYWFDHKLNVVDRLSEPRREYDQIITHWMPLPPTPEPRP